MRDAVGHVAEQELLAALHSGVADDEHVRARRLRLLENRGRGLGGDPHDDARALAAQCPGVLREAVLERRPLGLAAGGGGRDLQEDQLAIALRGEGGGPRDGGLGGG